MAARNNRLRLGTAAFALGLSLTGAQAAVASADAGSPDSGTADSESPAKSPAPARGVAHSKPKVAKAPKISDISVSDTERPQIRVDEPAPKILAERPSTGVVPNAEREELSSTAPAPSADADRTSDTAAMAIKQPLAAAAVAVPVAAPVTIAKTTSATVPPDFLSNISDWIGSWPDSPIKSTLEGVVLMARRSFFNRDPITNPVQTITLTNGQIFGTLDAFDPEGDAIEYAITQGPKFGTLTIDSFGAYVYTPGEGYTGTDSFVVNVDDPGNHINLGRLFASGDLATVNVVRNAALPSGSVVDNFGGAAGDLPDSSNWNTRPGHDGGIQVYTDSPSNLRLDGDGNLIIEAQQSEDGYTSARIATQDLMHIQYGTVVARIKMPAGQGLWPSFWMLGEDYADVGWPGSGEIDIMELINNGTTYHVTLHGPQEWPSGEITDYFGGGDASGKVLGVKGAIDDLTTDYHDYWLKWREDYIEIGVDNQTLATFTPDDLPEGATWKFNQPMFVVMQLAVGGTWAGPPDDTTEWPARMLVDSFQYTPYV